MRTLDFCAPKSDDGSNYYYI